MVVLNKKSAISNFAFTLTLVLSVLNNSIYGEANFKGINMIGPYQVGHKDIYSSKDGVAVSVYYPMDRAEYARTIRKRGRNTRWLRYDKKSLKGVSIAVADIGARRHPPTCLFNYMKRIKMFTAQNGSLSKDFQGSDASVSLDHDSSSSFQALTNKKLIPVILCHGLSGSRTSQSGSCRDMASHGYIVFSLDHHDGSAYYSQKEDGQELFWSLDQDLQDIELRKKQLLIRENEVQNLID